MSSQQDPRPNNKDLEYEIVRYLRDHPDFFERHRDLLADMILPHDHGEHAISLVERQVSVLRDQKDQYRHKLQSLISLAEQNEKLSENFNKLILELLDTDELQQVFEIINTHLQSDFKADAISLRLFNSNHPQLQAHPEMVNWSAPLLATYEKILQGRRPVCGALKPAQLEALFEVDDNIQSAAIVPLLLSEQSKKCYGLLAIGSRDPQRFRADMGTLFLTHLGRVLSRVLKKYLD